MDQDRLKIEVSRLHKLEGDGKIKAFADVNLGGEFIVKGLKVVENGNGPFVGMPSKQGKDGKWYNIAHPITKELHDELKEVVLAAYKV